MCSSAGFTGFLAVRVNSPGVQVPDWEFSPLLLQSEYMHSLAKVQLEWSHLMIMQDCPSYLSDDFSHFAFCYSFITLSHCDIFYLKIIKPVLIIAFLLFFALIYWFFSLEWFSIRRTKSHQGAESNFINSSWIKTGISIGNHQNHELVSWETLSWNSCA